MKLVASLGLGSISPKNDAAVWLAFQFETEKMR